MKQLQMNLEMAERLNTWQQRVDMYAGLPEVSAWELHMQEVQSRFAFGSAPAREVLYVQRRFEQARGLTKTELGRFAAKEKDMPLSISIARIPLHKRTIMMHKLIRRWGLSSSDENTALARHFVNENSTFGAIEWMWRRRTRQGRFRKPLRIGECPSCGEDLRPCMSGGEMCSNCDWVERP